MVHCALDKAQLSIGGVIKSSDGPDAAPLPPPVTLKKNPLLSVFKQFCSNQDK